MNIDGTNHASCRAVGPVAAELMWKATEPASTHRTGPGLATCTCCRWAGDRADVVQTMTRGTYMLTTAAIVKGKAVACSRLRVPGHRDLRLRAPQQVKQLTNVNEDILAGEARRRERDVVHLVRRLEDPGWYITPPDFVPTNSTRCSCRFTAARQHVRVGSTSLAGACRQRLRRALHQSPRQHRLRQLLRHQIMRAYPSKDYDDRWPASTSCSRRLR